MPELYHLLADLPAKLPAEMLETILEQAQVRFERIVSQGHASPPDFWYDQDQAEFVVLLQGAARVRFFDEDQALDLFPGDALHILPHQRHRVEWTASDQATIWLAIHYTDAT